MSADPVLVLTYALGEPRRWSKETIIGVYDDRVGAVRESRNFLAELELKGDQQVRFSLTVVSYPNGPARRGRPVERWITQKEA